MKHLWEVRHPYYCHEDNFYSNKCHSSHQSWRDFMDKMADADMDLNLLFRWDWQAPREDPDSDLPIEWQGDENYRDSTLQLFFVGQRKGIFFCNEVQVCRADEPAIRMYLGLRLDYLMKLWAPLLPSEELPC